MKTLLIAVLFLSGCTMVSYDRVFPKPEWYWQKQAIEQRKQNAAHKRAVYEFDRTNSMYTK